MANPVTLLVGTTKGLFLLDGGERRDAWNLRGPYCSGWPINHAMGDPGTGRIWAGGGSEFWGAGIWKSENSGESWKLNKLSNGQMDAMLAADPAMAAAIGMEPSPPAPFTGEMTAVWSLGMAGDTLYAGTKPAMLYQSTDGGESWSKVDGLANHPSREGWEPGGAGLILHSIVADPANPDKLWVATSAAGLFATEDRGRTWDRRNRRSNIGEAAHHAPHPGHSGDHQVGMCVHNIVRASTEHDILYQQNHEGVFRSTDGGRSWHDAGNGLPTNFGFPIAVHPQDERTIWVFPLTPDEGRYPPDASAAVWRSRDGGESWAAFRSGLPSRNCFFTVLRQAMASDRSSPAGVYFGTNSGSVFASIDEGESWSEVARHLPTVLCVEAVQRA